ncbi:MAG: phosphoenolpyruvate--protein phosphotransferase [Kiritimatiellae bacterium]|jgi:phosphotransferase system enzyme I (PtsI)|nr:phosphoenolpyruvate--protein phosphotransferase [Kiritimatiellia bacterium]MDD2347568.1 phosphoenolpyruvate--protein phosphotransferase [Kiritimatiellia bacterium]MDD3583303.1 phosphoenolpyruvate--protein phosphotransferase [Kiritimatiellia bacterium]HHU14926.1 phosphoenolpyruvate--protein phosphotransferase [Lentisphaerota bacterium]HON47628.1 phosphoenolpyruvate--protein phosphotransferase [Kiritimatiellia bacterium]
MNSDTHAACDTARDEMRVMTGLAVSRGFVMGPAFLYRAGSSEQVPEYRIEPEQVEHEVARLVDAFALTRTQINTLAQELKKRINGDEASIFDGHLMILDDPTLQSTCKEKIVKDLRNAEAAVKQVADTYSSIFDAMDDSYLRERAQDVGDIVKRILRNLSGVGSDASALRVEYPCIVVADELSPSEAISLPKHQILGFATDRGSTTSHASLLARALGIPAVVGLGALSAHVKSGDLLLLDGTRGKVVVNPDSEERAAFEKMMARSRTLTESLEQATMQPGRTLDVRPVPFLANVDSSTALADLHTAGAEGIGLYRTEYLWLQEDREPSEEEQTQAYTEVARALPDGQAVAIRVLDLGGDKMPKSGGIMHREANPFLGNRSIRFLLRNPDVFHRQLRAVLRASAHGNVQILYPMVTTIDELHAANMELHTCMAELKAQGIPFDESIQRGVMIEVPAAALIADALAKECEFFSIGTNDLIQYTLAVDRVNETVARLYQPTHPAVLQLIDLAVTAAHANGLRVSVCGETAADPVMAMLFIGMGVDELSMSPNLIRLVKRAISQISFADAKALADSVRRMMGTPADQIYAFCRNQLIKLVPDLLYLQ